MRVITSLIIMFLLVGFVSATDVAYIVRNVNSVDSTLTNALTEIGYSYDIIDDSQISRTDFSNYGMLLVDKYISNAPINDYNALIVNPDYYEDWSSDIGDIAASHPLTATNNLDSSITAGLPEIFEVYTQGTYGTGGIGIPMSYLVGRKIETNRVTSTNNLGEFVIATKEEPRQIFFGITETDYWTSNTEQLFKNSVYWILVGEDIDGDGFYSIEDCDDHDIDINPEGIEIAYDGIDQDCSGSDLTDVDEDGYDSEIVGGLDCNDENSAINPDEIELLDHIDQNCFNDAPIFINGPIPDFQWNEDQGLVNALDLNNYFTDPDGDVLSFEIYDTSDQQGISLYFDEGVISFTSDEDWYGEDWVIFKAFDSDSELAVSNSIALTVLDMSDDPTLQTIPDISVTEGELVTITATATDPNDDPITYSISGTDAGKFTQTDDVFSWQTDYDDEGSYVVTITATDDDLFSDSQDVEIVVAGENQPPQINPVADLTIDEDSGFNLDGTLTAVAGDGGIERFEIIDEDLSKVDCSVTDSVLGVTPAEDWEGTRDNAATCTVQVVDSNDKTDAYTFKINVVDINDEPIIDSFAPDTEEEIVILEDGSYDFSVQWHDIDNADAEVEVNWYVDEVQTYQGNSYVFQANGQSDEYEIQVVVKDLDDETDSKTWTIQTSDHPITEKYNGDTTDFGSVSDISKVFLVLEILGYGKVEFLEAVNLDGVLFIDDYSDIQYGLVAINTNINPLNILKNKKARVTFYNLDFDKTPTIYYSNGYTLDPDEIVQECGGSLCSDVNYENNELSFEVDSFSSFMIGDTLTCAQKGGTVCIEGRTCESSWLESKDSNRCCATECVPEFSDIERCVNPSEEIKINLKDPDENEEFNLAEIIEGKLKIKNNFEDDKDFEVEVFLYDLTTNDEVEDFEDNLDIDNDESEELNFEIELEDDLNPDHQYTIFVKVSDEDDENICNQEYVEIDIEKERHSVIVQDFEIVPKVVEAGKRIDLEVEVENIGERDEVAYVEIRSPVLKISQKTEEFEIDEDDRVVKQFFLDIPEDLEQNDYQITATVFFNDGDSRSMSAEFGVLETVNPGVSFTDYSTSLDTLAYRDSIKTIELEEKTTAKEFEKLELPEIYIMLSGDEFMVSVLRFILAIFLGLLIVFFVVVLARVRR